MRAAKLLDRILHRNCETKRGADDDGDSLAVINHLQPHAKKHAWKNDDSDKVDASIDQSVTSNHSLDISGYDDVIVKTIYKSKTKIKSTEDLDVSSEAGDINGALIDIDQLVDINQFTKVVIKVKERGDDLFVKVKVFEKTTVKQHTDIDVLLTNDDLFDVDVDQSVNLTQDNHTKIIVKGGGDLESLIDLDVLLAQTAVVNQQADVVFGGTPDDFTVAIDASQDVQLDQQVAINLSLQDLWLA